MISGPLSTHRQFGADDLRSLAQVALVLLPAAPASSYYQPLTLRWHFTPGSDAADDPLADVVGPMSFLAGTPAVDGDTGFFTSSSISGLYPWTVGNGGFLTEAAPMIVYFVYFDMLATYAQLAAQPLCLMGVNTTPTLASGNTANDCALQIDLEYRLVTPDNPYPPVIISQQPSR